MSESISVEVTVSTEELRKWAEKHTDAGHHGVAHVLYQAAKEGEALTEQVIREAKAEAWDEAYWQGVDDQRTADSVQVDIGLGPENYAQPNRSNPHRKAPL